MVKGGIRMVSACLWRCSLTATVVRDRASERDCVCSGGGQASDVAPAQPHGCCLAGCVAGRLAAPASWGAWSAPVKRELSSSIWKSQQWHLLGDKKYKCVFSFHLKFSKSATVPITSNLAIRAWNIKYRQKKLIAQFSWKLRDDRFEPN